MADLHMPEGAAEILTYLARGNPNFLYQENALATLLTLASEKYGLVEIDGASFGEPGVAITLTDRGRAIAEAIPHISALWGQK